VTATRYVAPLREGGSLPGLMEADDEGLYVTKFRAAGQGERALVAEVVAGELARAIGLPVPDLVIVDVAPALGLAEPDPEIQDLIVGSPGENLGMDFLPGALPPALPADPAIGADLAADVVWFDALVTNVDRTHRNPNLLVWHGRLWLIDHGAALYLQHAWSDPPADAHRPFPAIRTHVLLPCSGDVLAADARLASRLDGDAIERVLREVPEEWFAPFAREAYAEYLCRRLEEPRGFAAEAEEARRGG
jgi:hypothetical protein